MNIIFLVLIITGVLMLLVWLGLKIKPAPFPAYPLPPASPESLPLPADLPEPVERFYRLLYKDRLPVIHSAVISGRAVMKPFAGISLQTRFRFTHEAGRNYRHYIEATFFGLPFLKINERYLDRKSFLELPFGITDQGPKVDQAANLGLWAETFSMPAVFLTDPRVRWEPIDPVTAWLFVPFEDAEGTSTGAEDRFLVRFDPESGMPRITECMRYKGSTSPSKSLWITESLPGSKIEEYPIQSVGAATWFEDGNPWAVFTTEEVVLNADVSQYLRIKGL